MILVEKRNGLFDLRHVYALLRNCKDGIYRLEIKRVRRNRTADQNGWLWGCVYPLLLQGLLDAGWEFKSIEQVHEFFKDMFTKDRAINRHTGEVIEFPSSTALMDTVTFSTYTDRIRDYALEYLGVDIPDPDKNRKEKKT